MGGSAVGPPRHPDLLWVSRGGALCNLLQTLCRAARRLGWAPSAGAAFYFLFFFKRLNGLSAPLYVALWGCTGRENQTEGLQHMCLSLVSGLVWLGFLGAQLCLGGVEGVWSMWPLPPWQRECLCLWMMGGKASPTLTLGC